MLHCLLVNIIIMNFGQNGQVLYVLWYSGEHNRAIMTLLLQYYVCPVHISESIKENQMKLDTLRDGHQRYCRMQEL